MQFMSHAVLSRTPRTIACYWISPPSAVVCWLSHNTLTQVCGLGWNEMWRLSHVLHGDCSHTPRGELPLKVLQGLDSGQDHGMEGGGAPSLLGYPNQNLCSMELLEEVLGGGGSSWYMAAHPHGEHVMNAMSSSVLSCPHFTSYCRGGQKVTENWPVTLCAIQSSSPLWLQFCSFSPFVR